MHHTRKQPRRSPAALGAGLKSKGSTTRHDTQSFVTNCDNSDTPPGYTFRRLQETEDDFKHIKRSSSTLCAMFALCYRRPAHQSVPGELYSTRIGYRERLGHQCKTRRLWPYDGSRCLPER